MYEWKQNNNEGNIKVGIHIVYLSITSLTVLKCLNQYL